MSFRSESQRHASCHCRAGDSCSDREHPIVHPHICKVKRGGYELFNIMGWVRQFNEAQPPTQTSAQRMTQTRTETQQTEQQMHALTWSQFLISLLPWRALEAPWQGCNSRAKIGCTKNLPWEPILGSLAVVTCSLMQVKLRGVIPPTILTGNSWGNGCLLSVVLGKCRKPTEIGQVLLDAVQAWPVTAHASDAPSLSRQETWRAGGAASSSCQSPVFMWNSWLSFKIIIIIIKKSDPLSWKYDP